MDGAEYGSETGIGSMRHFEEDSVNGGEENGAQENGDEPVLAGSGLKRRRYGLTSPPCEARRPQGGGDEFAGKRCSESAPEQEQPGRGRNFEHDLIGSVRQ
jgi:hypothetical protein